MLIRKAFIVCCITRASGRLAGHLREYMQERSSSSATALDLYLCAKVSLAFSLRLMSRSISCLRVAQLHMLLRTIP